MTRKTEEAACVGLLALIARAGYVAGVVRIHGTTQYSDFLYMHRLAESLAAGRGFTIGGERIFNQSVGYPALLSVFYRLFGAAVPVALALNVVLGVLSVALVYLLGRRLFPGGRGVALAAGLLGAVYPDSLLYCAIVSSENLLIPLMLLLLLAATDRGRSVWASGALTGLTAAAAASAKAYTLVLCAFMPWVWRRARGGFLKQTLAAAVVGVVCLAPWTVINYRASGGRFVPFAAVAGTALLDGTNPEATGKPSTDTRLAAEVEATHDAIEVNSLKIRKVGSYVREDPAWFMGLTLRKVLYSLSPARDFLYEFKGRARLFCPFASRWLPTAFNAALLLGTAMGLWATRRRGAPFVVGFSLVAAATLLQAIFFAYSRYRFPFLFCLLPICAAGWLWAGRKAESGKEKAESAKGNEGLCGRI